MQIRPLIGLCILLLSKCGVAFTTPSYECAPADTNNSVALLDENYRLYPITSNLAQSLYKNCKGTQHLNDTEIPIPPDNITSYGTLYSGIGNLRWWNVTVDRRGCADNITCDQVFSNESSLFLSMVQLCIHTTTRSFTGAETPFYDPSGNTCGSFNISLSALGSIEQEVASKSQIKASIGRIPLHNGSIPYKPSHMWRRGSEPLRKRSGT